MLDKEERTRMLPRSSSHKTLRAVMQEERGAPPRSSTTTSRLLSTDPSLSNPSFRVYYGVASAVSVPFQWESAPGTPKHASSGTTLPPLTPPPSYYTNKAAGKPSKLAKSQSSKKLLSSSKPASFVHSILPKLRRSHTMPSPSRSSPAPAPAASKEGVQCTRRSRLLASPRSSFSSTSRGDDEDDNGGAATSPTSTLCFKARHSTGGAGRLHGLLASVVDRRAR